MALVVQKVCILALLSQISNALAENETLAVPTCTAEGDDRVDFLQTHVTSNKSTSLRSRSFVDYAEGWTISSAAYDAENSQTLPEGWSYVGVCHQSGVFAKILKKQDTVAVAFAVGVEVAQELSEYWKRANGAPNGFALFLANGFAKYAKEVAGCIRTTLNGTKATLLLGHSLGGAAATAYYQHHRWYTLHDDATVVTYGAPPTGEPSDLTARCAVPGTRYLHSRDPMGYIPNVDHQLSQALIYKDTSARRRFFDVGNRRRHTPAWIRSNCDQKSHRYNFNNFRELPHAIFLLSTIHTNYGAFLGTDDDDLPGIGRPPTTTRRRRSPSPSPATTTRALIRRRRWFITTTEAPSRRRWVVLSRRRWLTATTEAPSRRRWWTTTTEAPSRRRWLTTTTEAPSRRREW